jgi:hypothetical protein
MGTARQPAVAGLAASDGCTAEDGESSYVEFRTLNACNVAACHAPER